MQPLRKGKNNKHIIIPVFLITYVIVKYLVVAVKGISFYVPLVAVMLYIVVFCSVVVTDFLLFRAMVAFQICS